MLFFFFNDTATTEIYTLSLHDALPIWRVGSRSAARPVACRRATLRSRQRQDQPPSARRAARRPGRVPSWRQRGDRKSTRLNSSHANISYAVFCLKKKKITYLTSQYPLY